MHVCKHQKLQPKMSLIAVFSDSYSQAGDALSCSHFDCLSKLNTKFFAAAAGLSPEDEMSHVEAYYMYLAERQDGFDGTYEEYLHDAFAIPYQAADLQYNLELTGDEEVYASAQCS